MPHKAQHGCKHGNCRNLVASGESYCDVHKGDHKNDFARGHPEWFKLYNNKRWRRYRRMYLAEHPLCVNYEECHSQATVVDHIVDHLGDWSVFWDVENHQSMCAACHNSKTAKTRGWGRGRSVS